MKISDITTRVPVHGLLAGWNASLAIKVGDFINVLEDLSPGKMSHGGKGFVIDRETENGVSTFTVKYLEMESGAKNHAESGIPVSRMTVTPFANFGDGRKK
jgi:hypothetical protein